MRDVVETPPSLCPVNSGPVSVCRQPPSQSLVWSGKLRCRYEDWRSVRTETLGESMVLCCQRDTSSPHTRREGHGHDDPCVGPEDRKTTTPTPDSTSGPGLETVTSSLPTRFLSSCRTRLVYHPGKTPGVRHW